MRGRKRKNWRTAEIKMKTRRKIRGRKRIRERVRGRGRAGRRRWGRKLNEKDERQEKE